MSVSQNVIDSVRSAFDFEVNKYPLSGPDNMKTPWFGLFRDDTAEPVGNSSVTDRYCPHTTDDVIALVEASADVFDGEIAATCHFKHGHYVSIAPNNQYRQNVFGTKDNIFPRLMIRAGYDGKSFSAAIGYFRDLCQNLSMIKSVEASTVAIRHTKSLRPKMNDLIETFSNLKNGWKNLREVVKFMENKKVVMTDFLDAIYGQPDEDSKRSVTMHTKRTEAIFTRLQNEQFRSGRPEIGSDFLVSAWSAFNAVQGFAQHDSSRSKNATAFDRILLAGRDPNVSKAEELALSAA